MRKRGSLRASTVAAALAAFDELPHSLAALATDLTEELRASFPANDLSALATDLAVESGAVSRFGRLTALLAELAIAFGAQLFLARLASHPPGLSDRHLPTAFGHLSHRLSLHGGQRGVPASP